MSVGLEVGRAPSEASAGFSALESSCTGGVRWQGCSESGEGLEGIEGTAFQDFTFGLQQDFKTARSAVTTL